MAEETFSKAQVEKYIALIEGDALEHLSSLENIAFAFLDAEKEVYEKCYDLINPRMVKGGVLVADNAINH